VNAGFPSIVTQL